MAFDLKKSLSDDVSNMKNILSQNLSMELVLSMDGTDFLKKHTQDWRIGYTAGLEEGILLGGQTGDDNGDGVLNVLDIVYIVDVILNP